MRFVVPDRAANSEIWQTTLKQLYPLSAIEEPFRGYPAGLRWPGLTGAVDPGSGLCRALGVMPNPVAV